MRGPNKVNVSARSRDCLGLIVARSANGWGLFRRRERKSQAEPVVTLVRDGFTSEREAEFAAREMLPQPIGSGRPGGRLVVYHGA